MDNATNALGQGTTGKAGAPRILALNGRIGRLRYLASLVLANLVVALLLALIGLYFRRQYPMGALFMPMISPFANFAASMIYVFIFARRRLQDLNAPWGFSLLALIPFVHYIVGLALLFPPGSAGVNRYGAPPAPNSSTVYVITGLALAVVTGTLAVVYGPPALRAALPG